MSKEKYVDEKQEKTSINSAFFDGPQKAPFKFWRYIYNRKEGTILGRNTESWSKLNSK